MIEPRTWVQTASDGYPIHVTSWKPEGPPRAHAVLLHGVQSHAGWYTNLGRVLATAGYETHFPDRRGSGSNQVDRGHAPSSFRLVRDTTELMSTLKAQRPEFPVALGGISWGGKIAVVTAAKAPELVDALALLCPGLQPRVDVTRRDRLRIAWAFFTNQHKMFPLPLADPALFTGYSEGQAFIASDPLSIRQGTAGLLATSSFLDRRVARAPRHVRQPTLLMLAGHDRIVDNDRTRAYFARLASTDKRTIEYPEGHHTLEFEPDPSRYALDLAAWLDETLPAREPSRSS